MTQQTINIGTVADDGTGDTLRNAFDKCNDNFDELYFNLVVPYRLVSGGTNVEIGSANANITMDVNGTANIAVFSTAGLDLDGRVIITGNLTTDHITGASLTVTDDISGSGRIDVTGNAVLGNVSTATITATADITATGNIESTGGFVIGDGGLLSNVTAVSNVAVSQIANGTSVISFAGSGGNIQLTSGGTQSGTITSTGANITGYANITGNISTAENITATGNITGAYILGNGSQLTGLPAGYEDSDVVTLLGAFGSNTIVTTGNITAGNIIATTAIEGTLSTATQTSITSVGTLSNLTMGGNIVMASNSITGLPTPNDSDEAATKGYVDTIAAEGIHYHDAVRLEAPVALNATYDNGSGGVGATLTNAGANATLVIDGVTTQVNDRVLIYEQANAAHNGIYDVTTVGNASAQWVMTRSTDADSFVNFSDQGLGGGDAVFIQEGNTGAGEVYEMSTTGNLTIGTSNINWVQIKSVQVFTANAGVDLSGTNFSLDSSYSPTFAGLTVPDIDHSGTDGVGNIGNSSNGFNTVFAKATSAEYADVAEMYASDADYEPGTVVVFGGSAEVTQSARDADAMVAGVVSTAPAYLMNDSLNNAVPVALLGRVPTKVQGTISRGQMLVSTDNGRARAEDNPKMGTVIGKALEDFNGEQGVIEVVIGRL